MHDAASLDGAIRKAGRAPGIIGLGLLVFIIGLVIMGWIRNPPRSTDEALVYAFLPVAITAALVLLSLAVPGQVRKRVSGFRTRIRDAGTSLLSGLVFVLDDGLFVQPARGCFVTAFFTSSGDRMVPTAKDAIRWTRPFGWKRKVHLRIRRGGAGRELDEIGSAIGSFFAHAVVWSNFSRSLEPNRPAWMASASFFAMFPHRGFLDRIVAQSGWIGAYLEKLVRERMHPVPTR